MVDLMAQETRNALRKFYRLVDIQAFSTPGLGLIMSWSMTNATIFRQSDLDELMNDPKFVELLTIEHLNGE